MVAAAIVEANEDGWFNDAAGAVSFFVSDNGCCVDVAAGSTLGKRTQSFIVVIIVGSSGK